MKRLFLTLLVAATTVCTYATAPNSTGTYYQNADGKTGEALKTAFYGIINSHTTLSYSYLWTAFETTDVRSDGYIWDMYSGTTSYTPGGSAQGASYSKEGDSYNREHSFPKSWFGGDSPMYTDLHHMYPTDGFVNNKRANYPFGEVSSPTYSSNDGFSKLGPCSYSGYTGTVFEPADEYKGDFARTYFYMVTCYENKLSSWYSNYSSTDVVHVIDGTTYPAFQDWQLNLLLEWAEADPVSDKETARNTAVYNIQGNRNPFIDYPGLEQYIWGDLKTTAFSYDNYENPDGSSTGGGESGGGTTGDVAVLFHETFGNNTGSQRDWNDDYSVKSGVSSVYSGITGYTISNVKQGKNTTGSTASGLNQVTAGTDAYIIIGPLNVADYNTLTLTYQWKAGSIGASYSTSLYYATSSTGTYTEVSGTGDGATSFVERSYSLPAAAQVSTLYLKIVWNTSNTQAIIDEVELTGTENATKTAPTTYATATTVTYGTPFTLVSGTHFTTDGTVTLSSSNTAVATVSDLTITPVAVGSCVITVTYAEGETYAAGSSSFMFIVEAPEGVSTAYNATGGTATLDFTSNDDWELPTSSGTTASASYTDNQGYTITLSASTAYYFNSNINCLMLGKNGSTLTLPAFDKAVTQIDVVGRTGASENVAQNIYVGTTAVSTATTGATGTNSFVIDENYQSAGNIYTLKVTSSHNTQITSIIIHFADATLTATLNKYGYATYCSAYPLDFSATSGFTAWQVESVTGTTITFSEITEAIKGGQGVLLYNKDADGENKTDVELASTASTTVLSDNLLYGTLAPTYVETGTYYGLSGQSFVPVNAGTVPAGKALLPVSDNDVKAYTFVFNHADGITTTTRVSAEQATEIFNLSGQRLPKMQRGLNIINGKKIIVK